MIEEKLQQIEFDRRKEIYLANTTIEYQNKIQMTYFTSSNVRRSEIRQFYEREMLPIALSKDIIQTSEEVHNGVYHLVLRLRDESKEIKKSATIGAAIGGIATLVVGTVVSGGLLLPILAGAAGAGGCGALAALNENTTYHASYANTKKYYEKLPLNSSVLAKYCHEAEQILSQRKDQADDKLQKAYHALSGCRQLSVDSSHIIYLEEELQKPSYEKIMATRLQ